MGGGNHSIEVRIDHQPCCLPAKKQRYQHDCQYDQSSVIEDQSFNAIAGLLVEVSTILDHGVIVRGFVHLYSHRGFSDGEASTRATRTGARFVVL
ncbi:hypothetical protein D3C75_682410 [compost metagenome]